MKHSELVDLAIIGAGVNGLSVAKTYKDVNPNATILILDNRSTIGGTWSREALYPGLKTNNHFGSFEFSDFPMNKEGFGNDAHIPGQLVHNYLYSWAEKHELLPLVRLGCSVQSAEDKDADGWILNVMLKADQTQRSVTIEAKQLVVSTGLTSDPFMPKYQGGNEFNAPIYHTSDFAKAYMNERSFRKIVVLGGNKSSWDIAQEYAASGVQVDWVIRKSGHGPCWMTRNRVMSTFLPELFLKTRLITWFSPCIWEDVDGFGRIRRFLHRTWLGRKIVDGFFGIMQRAVLAENGYHKHPETSKLRPWNDMFPQGLNLLNYGEIDFFQLVRSGKIRVHIADVTHLTKRTVHLSDGNTLAADVMICGTGWKDTPPFNFIGAKELGLPCHISTKPSEMNRMAEIADREILERFPKLASQPPPRTNLKSMDGSDIGTSQPWRLYRFMVPPAYIQSRTLAFAGVVRSPSTALISQTQALWITAFLTQQIPSLANLDAATISRVSYETVLHSQFSKWRYSRGFGDRFPELWFDSLPYLDLLITDLGLKIHRKPTWWSECFKGYSPQDYTGLVEEWKEAKRLNSEATV
ncbi:FAD/NAD(P)-binding domain-containing protein [Mytilinidion resinicola]|uniref:FAD/NAD(P)-binding domain-containing protein n=1 Tax=Mytilinidion resinicola TaxID=574789 RepID=A0A6A6XYY5_9PEZI|nr:FAD/NAD(P)-binding domain-containing protein [Mytilinidion resinicola]KAF2801771.1 FAD/NAD(P)-binding domain-containing protein [Mytilinidion resinicola]